MLNIASSRGETAGFSMRASGYAGYLGIEYVWIDWEHCNEVDNLSETIRFRDYLSGVME